MRGSASALFDFDQSRSPPLIEIKASRPRSREGSGMMRGWAILLVAAFLAAFLPSGPAAAQEHPGSLAPEQLIEFAARALNSEAAVIRIEAAKDQTLPVSENGKIAGFLGSTWQIAHTAGYSGRPIDILVLVDTQAVIRGTLLVSQQEPVLTLGISPDRIAGFVSSFEGYDLKEPLEASRRTGAPDAIAGATISSGVIGSGVIRTARTIAAVNGLIPGEGGAAIDMAPAKPASWDELLNAGAVARLLVSTADADKSIGVPSNAEPSSTFIELFAAVLDPPSIGVNLLGEADYSALMGSIATDDHAILIAANGLHSFKGTSWRKTGTFERIALLQGERTIQLTAEQHRNLQALAAKGAPELREIGVFVLPQNASFRAAEPFRLSLIATREDAAGAPHSARFELNYALPSQYIAPAAAVAAPPPEPQLWQQNWKERVIFIGLVAVMLLALYLILVFQNQIAARASLYRRIRTGYLFATVIVLGLLIGAQLSVVHVLTFVQALRADFAWETFLLDPAIFIIWSWVAVALLFWGRVYCGWLCPFGALQELLNMAAQKAGVKQLAIPFALHERLWPTKYIIFLGLFAASLASMTLAFKGAEAEPFKTVVTLHFMREWPFVAYALALLIAGLFVERFFCRYLCPLGAALAIPARLRMFEWLKRRPQCGRECRICSTKCPVQAIHPEGQINPNECIYCLHCQTLYFDEHICPPLKARAARRAAFNAPTKPEGDPQ
jgi:transcriptional regulator of nitric oxide reductase